MGNGRLAGYRDQCAGLSVAAILMLSRAYGYTHLTWLRCNHTVIGVSLSEGLVYHRSVDGTGCSSMSQ